LYEQIILGTSVKFPIEAKDLKNLQGKKLGDALRELKDLWIKSEFTLSKKDLLKNR
jgi:hypothetical protein